MTDDLVALLAGDGVGRPLGLLAGEPIVIGVDVARDAIMSDLQAFAIACGRGLQPWQLAVLASLDGQAITSNVDQAESRHLETREQTVKEICRLFGVHPVMMAGDEVHAMREFKPVPRPPQPKRPWTTPNRRNFRRSQKRR